VRTVYSPSRRSCDYRVEGAVFAGTLPDYFCVTRDFHARYSGRQLTVRLHGRRALWASRFHRVQVLSEGPRDR
jgi:hypothetical protein